jgi:choline dehydrogenase
MAQGKDFRLGRLVHQLRSGELNHPDFLRQAIAAGVPAELAASLAAEALTACENQKRLRQNRQEAYDFIIIGAGSAGSVLAERLSKDPAHRVLVLEAGGPGTHPDVFIPHRWPQLMSVAEADWGYSTVPQKHAAGRTVHCPRGKMLGGCGSHNASAWVRGHRLDFDSWAYQGNPGWDYETVRHIFKGLEDFAGGEDAYRGAGGPLRMGQPADPNPLARAFIEGSRAIGLPTPRDYNAERMEGASYFDLCVVDGERYGVARAFLYPAMARPNLTVLTRADVRRLLFEGQRCTGVEFVHEERVHRVRATREVILSAGAIGSPKLLLQSGVGPAEELRALGIDVVADLPGVGRNLQDHILLAGVNYECTGPLPELKGNAAEATLWWKSDPRLLCPDLQPVFIEFPFVTQELGPVPDNCYAIAPGLVRPAARGSVRLTSADPAAPPAIDMNYLGCEADLRALRVAVDLCREIGASKPFDEFRKRELMPGKRGHAEMGEWIRQAATTYFHPTSSCRMGIDADAVVDPRLQVHGLAGLRVADASAMPSITTGNTNAPTLLMGEQAARFILSQPQ